MIQTSHFHIVIQNKPLRIDLELLALLHREGISLSRAQLRKEFQQKRVFLQGSPVKASFLLPEGTHQISWVHDSDSETNSFYSERCILPIVYEDESLLIFNKESGIPSAPIHLGETRTAVGSALAHCPSLSQLGSVGNSKLEPGLLHRLDTGTSGLLIFAKTQTEFDRLRDVWKKREVQKIYRAWVELQMPLHEIPIRIEFPMAHDAKSSRKMVALTGKPPHKKTRGKELPALTHILSVRQRANPQLADVEVLIETGVMHQIRCHLASMGWPVLGDPIYPKKTQFKAASRLWLHAWRLKLPLQNGSWLSLEAQLPPDWNKG